MLLKNKNVWQSIISYVLIKLHAVQQLQLRPVCLRSSTAVCYFNNSINKNRIVKKSINWIRIVTLNSLIPFICTSK